jgi:hypothetical protein
MMEMKTITFDNVEKTMRIPLGTISAINVGTDDGITIKVSMINIKEKETKIHKGK